MSSAKKRAVPVDTNSKPSSTEKKSPNKELRVAHSLSVPSARTLDCSSSSKPIWLVKVPKYLSSIWEQSDGEAVGQCEIREARQSDGVADVEVRLTMQKKPGQSAPVEYEMLLKPTPMKMAILIDNQEDLIMEGQVSRRCDIVPLSGMDNKVLMDKDRLKKKETNPPPKIELMKDPVVNFKPISQPVERAKDTTNRPAKKVRDEKDVVIERLLSAFEKHQYISIKDLVEITQQPIGCLKDIMLEYCVKSNTGSHKNLWELKPQYRHY
ncbi:general transcription factor IIF subunit 2-like [Paramacrobiotus metropolitanus]|uniref:general transcription factor IIF subunit 2-like n=1 Tax=Paramacrobiotus metropolitanus TaxID=2943436 RepID=UPI00244585A0|nr:general transcription factor IIF subunit 2-like [Paramacrobiotus metropolitanus]XP_055346927.1 general transcription factor IIF subunit 2-like [Paramacrobiotus metropolitanus]